MRAIARIRVQARLERVLKSFVVIQLRASYSKINRSRFIVVV